MNTTHKWLTPSPDGLRKGVVMRTQQAVSGRIKSVGIAADFESAHGQQTCRTQLHQPAQGGEPEAKLTSYRTRGCTPLPSMLLAIPDETVQSGSRTPLG
ncbi:hypothetical protein EYF80_031653 [Liparis tanakae]|uniref:Uncharacterized protein n=1 Tax=Liparis tanakae TaxID=230148 RepID=A0A4Z2GXY5_9TELE|nr:hypothetical protein EYF80_031653 [Liparis tanakae]